jgi:endonuclease G
MKSILFSFILFSLFSNAAASATCDDQLVDGAKPVIVTTGLDKRTNFLCFSEMAVLHSGVTRTPLFAAAMLTRERIEAGRTLSREDNFHEEDMLHPSDRATLQDYKGSMKWNLQRGHLVANKDTGSRQTQYESFSLANIVPQNGDSNGNLWGELEQRVRGMAMQRGKIYVITGPVFDDSTERLNGRVLIPKRLFKAVYDPKRNEAAAYLANNAPGWDYRVISIAELTRIIGIDVFPTLSNSIKNKVMDLPAPTKNAQRRAKNDSFSWFGK